MKRLSKNMLILLVIVLAFGGVSIWRASATNPWMASASYSLDLWYTSEDLHNINTESATIEIRRLEPSEYQSEFEIIKWTGDDYYIAIPDWRKDTGWTSRPTILGENGIVAQYLASSLGGAMREFYLMPKKIVLGYAHKQGRIFEISYDGELLWGITVPELSHHITMLENGNFLFPRSGLDQAVEMTREGEIAWQWNALEGLPNYNKNTYVGWDLVGENDKITNPNNVSRHWIDTQWEWTHVNYVQKVGNLYLVGLRNLDLVLIINTQGEIVWSFGPGVIKHAHCPTLLENGNLLIYDNGNGRVVEITMAGEVIWEYPILAPALGWCQKLWNGNYFFTDNFNEMIYEVSPNGEVIKQIKAGFLYVAKAFNPEEIIGLHQEVK